MSLNLRARVIQVVAAMLLALALIWALAPYVSINYPARLLIDILDWPIDNIDAPLDRNTQWFSAVGAGLLALVAILLAGVVAPALKRGDAQAARVAMWAVLVWFVIDSAGSVAVGVWSNAFFNAVYAIALIVPLIGVRKQTQQPES